MADRGAAGLGDLGRDRCAGARHRRGGGDRPSAGRGGRRERRGARPDRASLIEFVSALREGRTPMCEVHENLLSFAMVEAAVASIDHGGRIEIDELLEQARVEAIAAETDERARELMHSWSSVREALLAGQ